MWPTDVFRFSNLGMGLGSHVAVEDDDQYLIVNDKLSFQNGQYSTAATVMGLQRSCFVDDEDDGITSFTTGSA